VLISAYIGRRITLLATLNPSEPKDRTYEPKDRRSMAKILQSVMPIYQ